MNSNRFPLRISSASNSRVKYLGRKNAEFEAKVADGQLIEPDDWMPSAYRTAMLRMAEHHANSEIIGALPGGSAHSWAQGSIPPISRVMSPSPFAHTCGSFSLLLAPNRSSGSS